VSSIIEDDAGNLWMSSDRGIFRVPRRELEDHAAGRVSRLHSVAYGREDGMLSAETNGGFQPAVLHARDGRLWYPTLVGVAIVDPARAGGSVAPRVRLEGLVANGRARRALDGLEIGRGSADVEIQYVGASLNAPGAVSYRYLLEGWDRGWIDAGTRRIAHYSRLAPGPYRFRVMAANRDGVWSPTEAALSFRVLPQFWQTWWFRTLAVAGLALLPLARDRRQRLRQLELTRVVDQRTRELREQKNQIERQAVALERQNEVLAENVRLKDDVERISRHDLRTPLSSIVSLAQIVREEASLPPQHERSLRLIEQAGYRVLNMASLTLDLFKMEQGTYRLAPTAVDIRAVTERVLLDLQALIRTLDVTVEIATVGFGDEAPMIRGDGLLSHSMLSNVVKNAIEASPRGGRVAITISREDDVKLRIHNRGAIPATVRERFFDKYATGGKKGGTGLGAYSARLMAQTQGGSMRVETSEDDGGSTLIIIGLLAALPTDVWYETAEHRAAGTPALPTTDWPERRLLVVDDDEQNRAILRHFLSHPRWTVDEAENGPLALRQFAERRYDFVFLDIEMPVMTGFDVAEQMRQSERERQVLRPSVIIALSSHDDASTGERALRSGCDQYLQKPVSRRVVVQAVLGSATDIALDDDVRDLLPSFLAKKREEVAQMAIAVTHGDAERVRGLSHRLRGSFSLYGFTEASSLCAEIEAMAVATELSNAAEPVRSLQACIERAETRAHPTVSTRS
jgi:signal transduction histidine kinase/DNA-binding NarL/FixJ family response regulator